MSDRELPCGVTFQELQQRADELEPALVAAGHADGIMLVNKDLVAKELTALEHQFYAIHSGSDDPIVAFSPRMYCCDTPLVVNGRNFHLMSNLLGTFSTPASQVTQLDIKLGTRSIRQSALQDTKLRPDMMERLLKLAPQYVTEEHKKQGGITKAHWTTSNDKITMTAEYGFRIQGIRTASEGIGGGPCDDPVLDWKKQPPPNDVESVCTLLAHIFSQGSSGLRVLPIFIEKLEHMIEMLSSSPTLKKYELIGNSILLTFNPLDECAVHLIDFGQAQYHENREIDHHEKWDGANLADGFLYGLEQFLGVLKELLKSTGI